jgi:hypothetical protein
LDFGLETTVDYSIDIDTKTSMQYALGWNYNMPACGESGCCVGHMDVDNYLLVPNDDASGYNAPWISDDIRTYQKPKPWCLSYRSHPSNPCGVAAPSSKLTVDGVQGTLFVDLGEPNRDHASARLGLKGIAGDFSLDSLAGAQLVHLRLGNYIASTGGYLVSSRGIQGKDLIVRLKDPSNPDSSITIKLSYNRVTSMLDVRLDADRIDLAGLHSYPLFDPGSSSGEVKTLPFRLFLGDRYYAEGELGARWVINGQNAICALRSR